MIDDADRVIALESGVLILTGGHCVSGNLFVSVATNKLEELAQWDTNKLASLFLHLTTISKYLRASKDDVSVPETLSCLADLRHASALAIKRLTECLESVEHQQRGTISTVYLLKPRNKTRSRILKKQLGVKPSKKRPRIPLFKIVLMKSLQELHAHIDVSQLTADFCGVLRHAHTSWMHLYTVAVKCIEGCHSLLARLPSVRDKVDMLHEYETDGQSSSQVQQLLADLTEKFNIILSESSLPLYLTLSKQTLFLLDHPSSDSHLSLVHPDMVTRLRAHLYSLYSELDRWKADLEDAWRVTESMLTVLTQVHRHRERAREIERKICEHYHPLLREHPIVGKTLSQAELYRAHFTTSLYDPAKELLSQATEILEAVQRLKSSASMRLRPNSTGSGLSDHDIADISKCLTTSIQPFTTQLQQLQQVYVSVHIFHLLFEKALIWYKKVLKFIPESLLQMCTEGSDLPRPHSFLNGPSPQDKESLIYMPPEWLGAVRMFVSRHPAPRQEHVDKLDENIPQHVDRKMRSQARSLALRLRLLQRILTSTRLPLKVVAAVLAWRAELFGAPHQDKALGAPHQDKALGAPHQDKALGAPHHDKALGAPNVPLLARDMTSPGQHTNQEPQQSDKSGTRSQPRPHSRVPEKPPRNKTTSMAPETLARNRTMSSLPAASLSGPTMHELRIPERTSVRKNSYKLLPRPKSVDFNLNSSSTDGSVFDYDRALVQAEAMTEAARVRPAPRKPRSATQPVEVASLSEEQHQAMWKDGHSFSESSTADHGLVTPSKQKQQLLSEMGLDAQSLDERFIRITFTPKQGNAQSKTAFKFEDDDLPEIVDEFPLEDHGQGKFEGPQELDPYDSLVDNVRHISTSSMTNAEKLHKMSQLFSLSSLDKGTSHNTLSRNIAASKMSYTTMDLADADRSNRKQSLGVGASRFSENADETERPVEAVLRMKRNLAKSMEDLNLSASNPQHSGNKGRNYSKAGSLVDKKWSQPKTQPGYISSGDAAQPGYRSSGDAAQPGYRSSGDAAPPVYRSSGDAARPGYRSSGDAAQPGYRSSGDAAQPSYRSSGDAAQPGYRSSGDAAQPGYRSSGDAAQHGYRSSGETAEQIVTGRRHSQNYREPDKKVFKRVSRDKRDKDAHSWSDVESVSQGISASLSSNDLTSHDLTSHDIKALNPQLNNSTSHQHNPSSAFVTSFTTTTYRPTTTTDRPTTTTDRPTTTTDRPTRTLTSRCVPTETHPVEGAAANDGRRMVGMRAAGPGGRNFLSPSFLRPASSMRDLSTGARPELTFDLEADLQHDYQTLEDLEILRTMQEEPVLREFRNFSVKPLKKHPSDPKSVKPTEGQSKRDNSFQPELQMQSWRSGTSAASRHRAKFVPEMRNSSQQWPWLDGDELAANDVHFVRLTSAADRESLSQEEVAESLRKTQKILEEEEARRFQRLQVVSDPSLDEEEDELGAVGGLSHTTSFDNGYGSWASKYMYSTGSDRDWRKLSTSSADSSTKLPGDTTTNQESYDHGEEESSYVLKGYDHGEEEASYVLEGYDHGEEESSYVLEGYDHGEEEASDVLDELPQIKKLLSGPHLF